MRRPCSWLEVFWRCRGSKELRPLEANVSRGCPQEGQLRSCLSTTVGDRKRSLDVACADQGRGTLRAPVSFFSLTCALLLTAGGLPLVARGLSAIL